MAEPMTEAQGKEIEILIKKMDDLIVGQHVMVIVVALQTIVACVLAGLADNREQLALKASDIFINDVRDLIREACAGQPESGRTH
jgi:hypothetical protein